MTTWTTSAAADVAEVVDYDLVSFHLEVALNIVLDWLGEGGRCNIRHSRQKRARMIVIANIAETILWLD